MLVCPTSSSDLAQLPNEEHRRSPTSNDADMVHIRGTFRCLCSRTEVQHSSYYSAAVLLCLVRSQLGAMHDIRPVSSNKLAILDAC
jgi:hypothetical protein